MITQFFGDKERSFALTGPMITELERLTGAGIGGFCRRLMRQHEFALADITETIRLALIGGGTNPQDALALVAAYAAPARPLGESYLLAVSILSELYSGPQSEPGTKDESQNG
jgi:hypothetical protein